MIEENIANIADNLADIGERLNPINDFGNTLGDELHQIEWQLSRIADALEAILKKMPQ